VKWLGRAALVGLLGVGAVAPACTPTTEATGFVFQYGIDAFGCDTTCATPGAAPIASAARGDTVWLQHTMTLVAAVDSFIPQVATVRPACAGQVAVVTGGSTVRSVPTPTCADSTLPDSFQLAGVDYPQTVIAFTQWVVDAGLAPGGYLLRGRVLVRPRLEPSLGFTVQ
jgi:hypothetical protein